MERVIWDLMIRWQRLGNEVICITTPLPRGQDPQPGPITIEVGKKSAVYSRRWWRASAAKAVETDPDVIFGCGQGAHHLAIHRLSPVPLVMQAHGNGVDEILTKLRVGNVRAIASIPRATRALVRDLRAYRRYDQVLSVGPLVTNRLQRYPRPVRPKNLVTIENQPTRIEGNYTRHMARDLLGWSQEDTVVVAAGRLHREKGFDLLVHALRDVPDARLVVVGDGPAKKSLERLTRQCGMTDRVNLVGSQPTIRTRTFLAAASIVVIPSRRYEGAPMVLHEALQANQRVIISKHNSAPYVRSYPDRVVATSLCKSALSRTIRETLQLQSASPTSDDGMTDRMEQYATELLKITSTSSER